MSLHHMLAYAHYNDHASYFNMQTICLTLHPLFRFPAHWRS